MLSLKVSFKAIRMLKKERVTSLHTVWPPLHGKREPVSLNSLKRLNPSFLTPRAGTTWYPYALNSSYGIMTWKVLLTLCFWGFLEEHCGES